MTGVGARDGLQPERTTMAWTRTSFAVLGNGGLLLLKNFHGHAGTVRLVAVGLALAIALLMYLIGVRRQRTLSRRPLPQPITPRRDVYLVGTAVVLLIVVTLVGLLV